MVKKLDEKLPAWPDHVGWRLWQANRNWQAGFVAAMQQAGHGWFSEARANLLGHVGRQGVSQSVLAERSGISKQAVQQLLDGLEAEGVVERVADSNDRRTKIVRYTDKGRAAMNDGNRVKATMEKGYRSRLGDERFEALMRALADIAAD